MTDTTIDRTSPVDSDARPRVVVGVDGSPGARGALRTALLEAARRHARLDVVAAYPVVLVWTGGVPVDVPDVPSVREGTRARAQGFLDEVRAELLVEELPAVGDVPVQLVVAGGPAAQVLVHRAEGADLLVVGSRGRGQVRSALLGSVALHCVTHAPCPVTVVHGNPTAHPAQPERVVVGVDGSDESVAALREAVGHAGRRGAELDVVVAYALADYWGSFSSVLIPSVGEIRARVRGQIDRIVERIRAEQESSDGPLPPVHVHLVEGMPSEALLDRAEGAALLVVGSRGHGAIRGMLLGSVALHCVVHAPCPVTVVHPQDRPAPAARSAEAATARG